MRSKEDQEKLDDWNKYFNYRETEVLGMVKEIDTLWGDIKTKIEKESKNDYDSKSIFEGFYNVMVKIKDNFVIFNRVISWEERVGIWTKGRPEFKE